MSYGLNHCNGNKRAEHSVHQGGCCGLGDSNAGDDKFSEFGILGTPYPMLSSSLRLCGQRPWDPCIQSSALGFCAQEHGGLEVCGNPALDIGKMPWTQSVSNQIHENWQPAFGEECCLIRTFPNQLYCWLQARCFMYFSTPSYTTWVSWAFFRTHGATCLESYWMRH